MAFIITAYINFNFSVRRLNSINLFLSVILQSYYSLSQTTPTAKSIGVSRRDGDGCGGEDVNIRILKILCGSGLKLLYCELSQHRRGEREKG